MSAAFDYDAAFARNIGWVTAAEQQVLRRKRVAIGGMGGVGGIHVLTLARLGIGAMNLADYDVFEIANFNRQAGATISTLGQPKVHVMEAMARDIDPYLDLRIFSEGITENSIDAFLRDVDVYVDGLDFFAFKARRMTFAACAQRRIPAVTVAPLGMGAALLNFLPGRMTFDRYFGLEGVPDDELALRFLLGLSPAMLQRKYLADPSAVNLAAQRGPSTVMACQLCAGIAATETLKLLLRRGKVHAAPTALHFDAYRGKLRITRRVWGNRNPLQRLAMAIARRQLRKMREASPSFGPAVKEK
ncbi:MAG TPA: ThiF family adenylyltransferase [Casimicrobiaceae bacterium]|nr:ThiF family adenylyltransferase [Casimicrobiaceae bacterium]